MKKFFKNKNNEIEKQIIIIFKKINFDNKKIISRQNLKSGKYQEIN